MGFNNFLKELKRRHVIKASISYVVFSWLIIQAASILYPLMDLGQDAQRITLYILIIGFPIWIVFAYIFDWTSSGFKKTTDDFEETSYIDTNKRMNAIIIFGLSLVVLLLIVDRVFNITRAPGNYDHDKSIAVLAFADMSPNKDQEYFSDGISEEILNLLAKVRDLKVTSRTSSFAYKGKEENIKQMGKELNVAHILEGSVRKSGNTLRITAQLINSKDGTHIWSETYDRELSDIFEIQDEIAGHVKQQLKATILNEVVVTPPDPKAYDLYLQGMFNWNKLTPESLDEALKYFEMALDIDTNYVLAYAGIADVWIGKLQQGLATYTESIPKIEEAVAKGMAIDTTVAEIYESKAHLCWINWKFDESRISFKKAIQLNPNLSRARVYYGHALIFSNQLEESRQEMDIALQLDPFNSLYKAIYGQSLNFTRQYDKAIELFESALKASPRDPVALANLRTTYHMKGMYDKALEVWKASYDAKGDHEAIEVLTKGAIDGGYQKALEDLAMLLIDRSDSIYVTPWQIATLYTRASQKEKALIWLQKAYEIHDANMPYIRVDPIFDILKGDPRFSNLLKKMNLSVENK
jgi:TolB-like protein/Tfp pilus assembly protein PilF